MNRTHHNAKRLGFALGILFVLAMATPATAQHAAYVSGIVEDSCPAGATAPACTRGLISVVNTDTNQVTGTIDVWRHDVLSLVDVLPNPQGTRLYVVLVVPGFSYPGPFPGFTVIRVFDTQTLQQVSGFNVPAAVSGCVFSPAATACCARAMCSPLMSRSSTPRRTRW